MLTSCNLMDNEIAVIPTNIAGMGDSLVVLQLRNNQLQVLPSCLSGLTGLKVLDVSNNRLHTLEPLSLPLLADLNLAQNALAEMPNLVGLKSLSRLVVSDNSLTRLPASLGQMPSLKQLVLDRNALTELPAFGKKRSEASIRCFSLSAIYSLSLARSLS
jgi:Leucine-rich repeat (LRR) protein